MTNADAPITIGLQRSYYSAEENSGQLQVCVEIVSGEVDGRAISLSYETINGLAVGMDRVYNKGWRIIFLFPTFVHKNLKFDVITL